MAPLLPGRMATSSWYGPSGGALRAGYEGLPQDLGQAGPAAEERDLAILYPNPLRDQYVTVRFHAGAAGQATFELYNLEGERVAGSKFTVEAGAVNEHELDFGSASSGVYLGRLIYPGASGKVIRTMTLAVER